MSSAWRINLETLLSTDTQRQRYYQSCQTRLFKRSIGIQLFCTDLSPKVADASSFTNTNEATSYWILFPITVVMVIRSLQTPLHISSLLMPFLLTGIDRYSTPLRHCSPGWDPQKTTPPRASRTTLLTPRHKPPNELQRYILVGIYGSQSLSSIRIQGGSLPQRP